MGTARGLLSPSHGTGQTGMRNLKKRVPKSSAYRMATSWLTDAAEITGLTLDETRNMEQDSLRVQHYMLAIEICGRPCNTWTGPVSQR